MLLGALLGLGADREQLCRILRSLPIEGFDIRTTDVKQHGHVGLLAEVAVHDEHHPHRGLSDIHAILAQGDLPERTRQLSLAVFQRLAEAEARVHGTSVEAIHFHEVGAMDAIVDIVGTCTCLELLDIESVACGPLPVGTGTTQAAHGVLPLPVPAVAELLRGFEVQPTALPFELVTPTGAALLTTWLLELPGPTRPVGAGVVATANGFGTRELPDRPNMIRGMLLDTGAMVEGDTESDACHVLECNLDDMSPELIGSLCGLLAASGALDVFTAAVHMKKQRPGVLLTVLCMEEDRETLLDLVFRESTTFGIREYPVERHVLTRAWVTVDTPYGEIRVKMGQWKGHIVTRAPEYEDCIAAAAAHGVPVKIVYEVAIKSLQRKTADE